MFKQKEVEAGLALLDAQAPGWEKLVDLERLDITSPVGCMLGQVYGYYFDGLDALKITDLEASSYGFQLTFDDSIIESGERSPYDRLTETWQTLLRERGIKPMQPGTRQARPNPFLPEPMPVLPVETVSLPVVQYGPVEDIIAGLLALAEMPIVELIDERELVLV